MSVSRSRLAEERKAWRKDKPFGFHARPETNPDGSSNLLRWKCHIPGRPNTLWEGGFYPMTMEFPEEYPTKPPKCKFAQGFFHPNVYPSGTVCLSIINEEEGWRPSITVKQVLLGIQELLDTPNPGSPAQSEAFLLYTNNRAKYNQCVKEQAHRYPPG
ncbi:unnamed protein product [Ostreobium quekettii]|uniref:SUMO-conjugating enzyme UBC9 n=1 Tax=Ostreobium quekettii TaxID=121088 RepID=A0A8S1IRZ4_9CHLO|nr:unnamed protein product [Ostreobium quekettii]|eukprot:evm.model.scf_302.4 EVM.evm.TU.scf_302.4   scf_302:89943-94261(-)